MRVLVALEPRMYREVLGKFIKEFRPHLEVAVIEPDTLYEEVGRSKPEVVLCSQHKPSDYEVVPAWIEYRPYTEPKATIYVGGQRFKLDVVNFADLLSVVDKATDLLREDPPTRAANS